jgi:hypothetical protein
MKLFTRFFATVFTFAALLFVATPAQAAVARVAWNNTYAEVVSSLDSSWNVKGAVADIDWYTGSQIKIVSKCSGQWSCVHIRAGAVSGAIGYFGGNCRTVKYDVPCKITIDVADAKKTGQFNASTKRWLVRHELGHWRNLAHSSSCGTTMYHLQRCAGKLPPNAFTSAERATLKTR